MKTDTCSQTDIESWLTQYLATVVGIDACSVDLLVPFSSYGLSSRESLELVGDLEDWLGSPCSDTLIYDYPNIQRLAAHLASSAR